ncbi:hypothetical protein SASPL_133733 [Salvia splendens]|uniref:PGG domain-containing protein n=1 Tax=Salvia splendens TaxID=180675 RepID=A0A8X8X3K0_SALSN|nr:hypothetical protein SASPL_133733 [Salvia splendens]
MAMEKQKSFRIAMEREMSFGGDTPFRSWRRSDAETFAIPANIHSMWLTSMAILSVLHTAARMRHLEVVKPLLDKNQNIGFKTDTKSQTALYMAIKGQNVEIVRELIKPDPLYVEDNKRNTTLHIATRKGRNQMVQCLLSAESPYEGSGSHSFQRSRNPPSSTSAKQLKQTVSDIKHDVQSQLQQACQKRFRVQNIAKKVKSFKSRVSTMPSFATVVAVHIATIAFAAIFIVPGQYVEGLQEGFSVGEAHIANKAAFIVFILFGSVVLFIFLAVAVVQTYVVMIEQKARKQLMFVINKLMWLACLFIYTLLLELTSNGLHYVLL